MAENQYIYAVARIRCREQRLLNASFLEQLVTAPDAEACMRLLGEKGWDGGGPEDSDGMLAQEQKRTWDLMRELVQDMSVFDVFLYENDYHNLKAAIKECKSPNAFSNIYLSQGTVPVERIRQAVQENRLEDLPERMREPAREARQALLHTGDGQLCDMILDRAALEAVRQAGEASGNELLKLYGEAGQEYFSAALSGEDFSALQTYFTGEALEEGGVEDEFEDIQEAAYDAEDGYGILSVEISGLQAESVSAGEYYDARPGDVVLELSATVALTRGTGGGAPREAGGEREWPRPVCFRMEEGVWKIHNPEFQSLVS